MSIFDLSGLHPSISTLLNIAYVVTVVFIILLIILENRSPLRSISWILVISLLPVLGMVFYFFFGQRYVHKRKFTRKEIRYQKKISSLSAKQIRQLSNVKLMDVDPKLAAKKDLMTLLLRSDRAFLSTNIDVKVLYNGRETFDELKAELKKAQSHIHLEFYIFRFDQIGTEIFEILKERARAGVEVRLIYDSVGSYPMSRRKRKEAVEAGVRMRSFERVYFPVLSSRVNYRNHRKIAVIDGRIGFTGGLNIADRYLDDQPGQRYWRDTFVKIEGKAVSSLQMIFMNDWFYVTKSSIFSEKYFKVESTEQGKMAQIISSGPDSSWHAILQFYFSAITTCRNYIYLTSPYFIPNDEISFALKAAALRGVDVRILIPEKSDTIISHWGSASYVKEMLKAGVKMYRYTKGFCHSKLLVCDGVLSSIGSANLDYRSLETNFEVNAVFYDEQIATELTNQFMTDLKDSYLVDLKKWHKRPWYQKLFSSVARIFAPLV
jgi:cardiolipin synthase A/B